MVKPIWIEGACAVVTGDQILDAALSLGLVAKEMGMKTPPGALHWHLSQPGSKGTLEITWLPSGTFIIEARANRFADWQTLVADRLRGLIGE